MGRKNANANNSAPYDDPLDHDHGYTEEEHRRSNWDIFGFFRGQAQGTVEICEGVTEEGDAVAGKPQMWSNDGTIYGVSYEEYNNMTPGDRADLRNGNS